MRIESSVTAVTWLPFAALDALPNMPLGFAVAHYDEPPGDGSATWTSCVTPTAFREANELRAWIEMDGGEIVAHGRGGRSVHSRRRPGARHRADHVSRDRVSGHPARSPRWGRGGCDSSRRSEAESACPRRGCWTASRTSTSVRRSPGRRWSSSFTPTARRRAGSLRPARFRATRSTTPRGGSLPSRV